jgi:hypothetical protein
MFIHNNLGIFAELPFFFPKGQTSFDTITQSYIPSKSLRFRRSNSAYLSRTPFVTGSRRAWTFSGWIKRGSLGTTQYIHSAFNASTNECAIRFNTDDTLEIEQYTSPSYNYRLLTKQVFRDTGGWFHLVVAVDTTQLLESSRIRVFINGLEIRDFTTSIYPTRNYDTNFNLTSYTNQIGAWNTTAFFDGLMANVYFVDGESLLPSSFGEINFLTGVWRFKEYSGSYGTNGFYLNFIDNSAANSSAIGKDYSGNYNSFTPTNISLLVGSTYDNMLDTPILSSTGSSYFSGTRYPYNALNFRSSASAYLSRTPSLGNRKTWTWSGWIKRRTLGTQQTLFGVNEAASAQNFAHILINSSNQIEITEYTTSIRARKISTLVFNDTTKYYHIVAIFNTPNPTVGDRLQIWVDGIRITSFAESVDPQISIDGFINTTTAHSIGSIIVSTRVNYFDGYMADVNFIDGLALDPTSFGETINGVWKPKTYSGTYGTNGFYLKFNDNSGTTATTIGKDFVGSNNWTPTNFAVTDVTSTEITSTTLVNPSYALQFRSNVKTYLVRSLTNSTGNKLWTWSAWVKRSLLAGTTTVLFARQVTTGNEDYLTILII